MKASVILAHPFDKSFNHAIFHAAIEALEEGSIEVYSHDLYKEGFDPVLTKNELGTDTSTDPLVIRYARELIDSNIMVFVHPNWWGQPPAILKGYVDRVIRPPYAYDFPEGDAGGGLPVKRLRASLGIVFNTSNTEEQRERRYFEDPLEKTWVRCVFGFLGIERTHRRMFRIVADSTPVERAAWLRTVKRDIARCIE